MGVWLKLHPFINPLYSFQFFYVFPLVSEHILSNNKANKIFSRFKRLLGSRVFQKGDIQRLLSEFLNSMEKHFHSEKTLFENGPESIYSTITYTKDLNLFIEEIVRGRQLGKCSNDSKMIPTLNSLI